MPTRRAASETDTPALISRANSWRFSTCGSTPGLPRPAIATSEHLGCCDDGWNPPRDQGTIEKLDLGSEVELSHLRSEITFEGSLSLDSDDGEVSTVFGEGRGSRQNHETEALSQIIDELNERFGLDLNERDQLFFDQIEGDWLADPDLTAQARNNSVENFRLVFDRSFVDTVAKRVMDNEDIARRFFDDEEFKQVLVDWYAEKVYRRARQDDERDR